MYIRFVKKNNLWELTLKITLDLSTKNTLLTTKNDQALKITLDLPMKKKTILLTKQTD